MPKVVKRYKDKDVEIGLKIRDLRVVKGLTRRELAAYMDISHQQLEKYERGINSVKVSKLSDLAHALDISVMAFFEEPDVKGRMYRISTQLMKYFNSIENENMRQAIYNLVKNISEK